MTEQFDFKQQQQHHDPKSVNIMHHQQISTRRLEASESQQHDMVTPSPPLAHLQSSGANTSSTNGSSKKLATQQEIRETEELFREVRIIMNKLTPQNMQKLTGDLLNLKINSEIRLKGCINIIFEKVKYHLY